MKISRDWLADFIDLGDLSDEQLSRRLTEIGHAVEAVEVHEGDSVFEIEFTSNRIDAMSHRGVARELAAALGRPVRPVTVSLRQAGAAGPSAVPVTITASKLCHRFTALPIAGVTVRPSSERVRRRLESVSLRPINNIVDATNYVMLALGHPLHAFDLDLLGERRIEVRQARKGEPFETLDGVSRKLHGDEVMIADGKRAIGLGGIMGGRNSEIHDGTRNVLLECAWFEPAGIRRSARRLGLKTDASYRFERGVDPGDTAEVIETAAAMILEQAGGVAGPMTDTIAVPVSPRTIRLRGDVLGQMSAGAVTVKESEPIFRSLGMTVDRLGDGLEVRVPTYRGDLREEMDLVEEALRLHGYDRIPASLPRVTTGDVRVDPGSEMEEGIRDRLRECGLAETVQYSFIRAEHNTWFTTESPLRIENALTENLDSMRLTLLPGLLETAAHIRNHGTKDGGIFEVGRTYHRDGDSVAERRSAAFVMFGLLEGPWDSRRDPVSVLDVKGIVEALAARFHASLTYRPAGIGWCRPGQAAEALWDAAAVARLGMLAPELASRFGLKGEIGLAEIDLEALRPARAEFKMTPVPRYPGVPMVMALVHSREVSYGQLVDAIRRLEVPNLHEIGLRDRYVDAEQGEEIKTTLGMWYQSFERSLTQEEVSQSHRQVAEKLGEMLPVKIL